MNDEECGDSTPLSLPVSQDNKDAEDQRDGDLCMDGVVCEDGDIGLKRQIGLLSLVAFLVGSIIGSGIFASPRAVAIYSGSSGVMLFIWVAGGVIALLGALTWCELALTFPNACGSEYSYVYEAFGSFPSFVIAYLLVIVKPAGVALISVVAGDYIMTAIVGQGDSVYSKAIAAAIIGINAFITCYSVKWGERTQIFFTGAKMIPITMLIITGLVRIGQGHTDNFTNAFNGSSTSVSDIAFALYGGLYAYGGWYSLSFLTAEIIDPVRNYPIAIAIGIPLVILCYVMVNIAYLTVKSPLEIATSSAIAVNIAEDLYGVMHWTIPVLVACSCFSTSNAHSFFLGRIIYEASNRRHLPIILGTVHRKRHTPIPAVIFSSLIAWIVLIPEATTFKSLLNWVQFLGWTKYSMATAALLWMRRSRPNLKRPIKLFIGIPILLFIFSIFVILAPFVRYPMQQFYGVCVILPTIPLYLAFVKYQVLPKKFLDQYDLLMKKIQVLGNLGLPDFEKSQRCESE